MQKIIQKCIDALNSYHRSSYSSFNNLPPKIAERLGRIAVKSKTQKGVFTVLVTLLVYKTVKPEQDIRKHQAKMDGFSGRRIDTEAITPTLKKLGYPAMAESGWLTRSLEQPYPYDLNYNGAIGGGIKDDFLQVLDYIQSHEDKAEAAAVYLLEQVRNFCAADKIVITPISDKDSFTINSVISFLEEQFSYKYHAAGGSKLPVIAFYSIYQLMVRELKRYDGVELHPLGSHTASDRTSQTAGDIELFKGNRLFEAVEVKLDKPITEQIVKVAVDKILKFNPQRYYILSNIPYVGDPEIAILIEAIRVKHGCQIIINGLIPTLKYYLRLVSDVREFVKIYLDMIDKDKELKSVHKRVTNELSRKYFS